MKSIVKVLIACSALSASAAAPLEIQHLGTNNSLVRIDTVATYLLIPIQENAPLAQIRVLRDGLLADVVNAPLATGKVDYFVPYALQNSDGSRVLLDIRSDNSRSNVREQSDAVWSRELTVSDSFDTANTEKFRPAFHHTPLYGWMNDPNGMFFKDGVWHLCYQWNPYWSKWQNLSWGHSTSKDLMHWDHHGPVLTPDALGMVFSGSSVVDKDNTAGFGKDAVIAMFTSADASQTQSLAYSTDGGYTFTHFAGNPVLAYPRESRDPNMFWDEAQGRWVLMLASALDHEMLVFTSPHLKTWTLESSFGKGFGAQDGVWECPDLLELPVQGTDTTKWVLICNINPGGPFGGSAVQYFVGDFDGKTFVCDDAPEVTKWLDYGKDNYAAVSFSNAPDNRKVLIGWMSNWQYANEVPTMQYRSANTLPRDVSLFRHSDGSLYVASVPSPEVEALRGKPIKHGSATLGSRTYALPAENGGICEIVLTLDMRNATKADITLSNRAGEKVVMTLDPKADSFAMDRTASGITDFSEHFPAVTVAPAYNGTGIYTVRLFIDRSSIEAFAADGHFSMTNLVFPESPYTDLNVSTPAGSGKARLENLTVYPLLPSVD
ncbi:MAG: DUF4980 domain-containing protein [Muribaculaceae bacterium]|nr:DUF4980 domain-containing protein [Muribaculaceae bacterium]